MHTEKGYTTKQVTEITNVKYRTLDYWAKSGFLEPSIARAAGTGSERVYSLLDLVALKVARELREQGISVRMLRRIVRYLRTEEALTHPLAEAKLVVAGKDVLMVTNKSDLVSILHSPGQLVMV